MQNPKYALLKQGERTVGYVKIKTPRGAEGQEIFTEEISSVINAPITGVPTARLKAFFRAGSATGTYAVIFALDGGNVVRMFVEVE